MNLSEEVSEMISFKVFKMCNDFKIGEIDFTDKIRNVLRLCIENVLSDPELLSKAGYVKREEVKTIACQFLEQLRYYELESSKSLNHDERTSEELWGIYIGNIDADLNPLPSPPQK